jgi:spermidine synthase
MKTIRGIGAWLFTVTVTFAAVPTGDYVESFDTLYNSLTVEKRGTIVELRARSRGSIYIESAVDLADPLRLVVPYTRTLYAGLFFTPNPQRVLMVGLGGAGFHRVFANAFPDALLQTVELDEKVYELCQSHLGFKPTANTPVALMDGRMFVKRDRSKWDWIILDAFRGGFVPPHLKTEEFYRECAARLNEKGVFITNLHPNSKLYASDLKTLQAVFPQVVLLQTPVRLNVIAFAVNYRTPSIRDARAWPDAAELTARLHARVDMNSVREQRIDFPRINRDATVLTDDFAPVEFLDAVKTNNTGPRP